MRLRAALGLCVALLGGCDFGVRLSETETPEATGKPTAGKPTATAVAATGIGSKPPTLGAPKPFEPPAPVVFQGPGGITVWLVERPQLPIVSATVIVPYGSASDPEDAPGTMALLADMLDEGAGSRDALQLSETVASLGATLSVGAGQDSSQASVLALKTKFDTAFELLSDVLARPKLAQGDFQRTKKLWKNALRKRSDDPMSVASTVAGAVLYGPKAPYGHPSLGLYSKADSVSLGGLKSAYERTYRPDRATIVIAGQITRAEVEALLEKHLGSWKPKGDALPPPKLTKVLAKRPKFIVVERPKAVQTVIYAAREGTTASDERAPSLTLVSDALGGSFTSRLNMNLREDKGWTYGVGSGFTASRGEGAFIVRTSVEAEHTGDALKEILGELANMSAKGLTDQEVGKVKAQDRADLVQTYEGATGVGSRLSSLSALGLPTSFDAGASRIRQAASREDLARLAKTHVDPAGFTVVLVGDRELIKKQLADKGLEAPVPYSAEGQAQ